MKDYYIRFGRRFAIPPTVQIKHEIMRIVLADKTPDQATNMPPAVINPAP